MGAGKCGRGRHACVRGLLRRRFSLILQLLTFVIGRGHDMAGRVGASCPDLPQATTTPPSVGTLRPRSAIPAANESTRVETPPTDGARADREARSRVSPATCHPRQVIERAQGCLSRGSRSGDVAPLDDRTSARLPERGQQSYTPLPALARERTGCGRACVRRANRGALPRPTGHVIPNSQPSRAGAAKGGTR
jgi:hypothetical protein